MSVVDNMWFDFRHHYCGKMTKRVCRKDTTKPFNKRYKRKLLRPWINAALKRSERNAKHFM